MTKGAVHDLSGGASKVLWEIKFQSSGSKFETHGFYWSDTPDPVNKEAISCWVLVGNPAGRDNEENINGSQTKPGQPYYGSAILGYGQCCCSIYVEAVKQHRRYGGSWDPDMDKLYPSPTSNVGEYGVQALKRILKSRGIAFATSDKKDALAHRLHDYLDEWIPASKEVARPHMLGMPDSWPDEAEDKSGSSTAGGTAVPSTANDKEDEDAPAAKKAKPADALPAMLDGLAKGDILEMANGCGAGSHVRNGDDLLSASAKALRMPRATFVAALKAAPGEIDPWHREAMPDEIAREISF